MANVCPICNNPLRQYGKDFYVCEVCETYFDKNENIILTEQEWLQTATTEQLAEYIYQTQYRSANIPRQSWMKDNKDSIMDSIVEWLKQPHTPIS